MANMSYCRFTNTLSDLIDCYEHMGDDDLSPEEQKAKDRMIEKCKEITEEYGDV